MPTIHDIARKAGVSATTVSRAFRESGVINAETQRRIFETARQMDYAPRVRKPSISRKSHRHTIAFEFFADKPADTLQGNLFYAPMLYGAQMEAARLGLNIMVHTSSRHLMEQDLPRLVEEWGLEGLLLVGGFPGAHLAELYASHARHLILLDNRDLTGQFESVSSDGFSGALQATRYLLKLGHRRIGFLLRETDIVSFDERLRGYQWGMRTAGITVEPELILSLSSEMSEEENSLHIRDWLDDPERPTAIIAANDETAMWTLRVCRQAKISIPEDLSVIGFDDIPISIHLNPALTTLLVNKEFMGRLAVQRLHARLTSGETEDPDPLVQHIVPVTLQIRESCRAL